MSFILYTVISSRHQDWGWTNYWLSIMMPRFCSIIENKKKTASNKEQDFPLPPIYNNQQNKKTCGDVI